MSRVCVCVCAFERDRTERERQRERERENRDWRVLTLPREEGRVPESEFGGKFLFKKHLRIKNNLS